jgi:uncharacterized protein YutD
MEHRTEVIVKYCRYGCGTSIHFEDGVVSSSGKKIPLETDNTPHNCPFSPYNEKKTLSTHDLEVIENVKKPFLNTLNRRLSDYVVIDFLIREKGNIS